MSNSPTILIAGITGGIGHALAKQLNENGYRLAGFSRREERIAAVKEEFPEGEFWVADGTEADTYDAAWERLAEKEISVEGYVHLLGSILIKPLHLTKDTDWENVLQINLTSAVRGLRSAVKVFQKQGSGSVVLASTVAARIGLPNHELIAAAKAGIEGMVRSAAASYAGRNIRINAVAPGLTDTPLASGILGNPQARAFSEKMHPLGRVGNPEEIAAGIRYLLSPDANWVTGQILSIDGGLSTVATKPKV